MIVSWDDYDIPGMVAACDYLLACYAADLAIIERALWIMRPLDTEELCKPFAKTADERNGFGLKVSLSNALIVV